MQGQKGRCIERIPLPLHCTSNQPVSTHREMADRIAMDLWAQFAQFGDAAVFVEIGEAGPHSFNVEFLPTAGGVRADPAIGDGQRLGARQAHHVMGADPAGGQLTDPAVALVR